MLEAGATAAPLAVQTGVAEIARGVNTVWILIAAFMVFLMQPGFALLEAGQVRRKNTANVLMKNLMDWSLGVLGYFVAGLAVATLVGGLTSTGAYSLAEATAYLSSPGEWVNWLHGAVFAMAAATIVSGAVAGRISFDAYVIYAVAVVVLIYPVAQGLVWSGGLLSESGYLGAALGVGYLDFAGGTVVHMVGGVAGLTAAYLIGPRADRYDEAGNSTPIPGHSVFLALLGSLILAFGWYGFNVGTQTAVLTEEGVFMGEALGRIVLITTLGMGAGSVGSAVATTMIRGTPDPIYTANGLLAGLVSVTAGAAHITWWGSILLGLSAGGLLMPTHNYVTERLKIDDVCGVFAVHGSAGALGALLIPLFAVDAAGAWTIMGPAQWLMQVLGVAILALWTVLATVLTLRLSDALVGNRVSREDEANGLDMSEHSISAYPEFVADGGTVSRGAAGAGSPSPAVDDPGESSGQGGAPTDGGPTASGPIAAGDDGGSMVWRGETVETGEPSAETAVALGAFERPALVLDEDGTIAGSNVAAQEAFGHHEPPCEVGTLPSAAGFADRLRTLLESPEPSLHDRAWSIETGEGSVAGVDRWAVLPLVNLDSGRRRYLVVGREESDLAAYRERLLETHRESLAAFADGDLSAASEPPDPPVDAPAFRETRQRVETCQSALQDATEAVEAVVVDLPDRSEELLEAAESITSASDGVTETAVSTSELAGEVSERLGRLSAETREASELVEDQSATIEEISAQVSTVAEQSETAAEKTDSAAEGVATALEGITEATRLAESTAEEIETLDRKIDDVEALVDTVESIAEETNVLALNASIEAARSDAGSEGFAVVAEEVKQLAENSKRRAEEIDTIVGSVVEQTAAVRSAIEESTETLGESTDSLRATKTEIDRANAAVTDSTEAVESVADAVGQQAETAEEVAETIVELRQMADRIDAQMADIDSGAATQAETMDDLRATAGSVRALATDVDDAITAFEKRSGSRAFSG